MCAKPLPIRMRNMSSCSMNNAEESHELPTYQATLAICDPWVWALPGPTKYVKSWPLELLL